MKTLRKRWTNKDEGRNSGAKIPPQYSEIVGTRAQYHLLWNKTRLLGHRPKCHKIISQVLLKRVKMKFHWYEIQSQGQTISPYSLFQICRWNLGDGFFFIFLFGSGRSSLRVVIVDIASEKKFTSNSLIYVKCILEALIWKAKGGENMLTIFIGATFYLHYLSLFLLYLIVLSLLHRGKQRLKNASVRLRPK